MSNINYPSVLPYSQVRLMTPISQVPPVPPLVTSTVLGSPIVPPVSPAVVGMTPYPRPAIGTPCTLCSAEQNDASASGSLSSNSTCSVSILRIAHASDDPSRQLSTTAFVSNWPPLLLLMLRLYNPAVFGPWSHQLRLSRLWQHEKQHRLAFRIPNGS